MEYGFHMSWIAEAVDGGAVVRHLSGNRTDSFQGVLLRNGRGLGGQVHASGRALCVEDYFRSSDITHDYDQAVAVEELWRAVAAPMVVGNRNYGVLLAGHRDAEVSGARAAEIVDSTAQRCAEACYLAERVRDAMQAAIYESNRRTVLALHDTLETTLSSIDHRLRETGPPQRDDAILGQRLRAIECQAEEATGALRRSLRDSLAAPVYGRSDPTTSARRLPSGETIPKRQYDVLCRAAMGETNSEIAAALQLSCNTVKTYLQNVMSKLGARNRVEAVVHAKDLGLL
jgi:DNA-binding NarL/FixJ family response regulator